MAAFTAKDVKLLRDKTGCGMMDCKDALKIADGDFDKAIDVLREKGLAKAAKKADRIAAEGVAYAVTNAEHTKGVVIEVNAETDFVAKNADFQNFVSQLAQTIMVQDLADVDALMACKAEGSEVTVEELLREKIQTIGENIKIRRFEKFDAPCVSYVHAGGKIGVLVGFELTGIDAASPEFVVYGEDIAMQVAALGTPYLDKESVPQSVIAHEKEIIETQMKQDASMASKPQNVFDKIVDGKVNKYYKENCLLEQTFVKDDKKTVGSYTKETAKALNGSIKIVKFVRFEKGEGLEKRQDDFASEVASMVK